MPACPFGVSVVGWTVEPRAQWSVGGAHRQHPDPPAVLLGQQRPRPRSRLGLLQAPIPWPPLLRSITNAPDPQARRAPLLAASCCDTATRSPESQTPLKASSRHFALDARGSHVPRGRQANTRIRKAGDYLLHADCGCPNLMCWEAACRTDRLYFPGSLAAEGWPMRSRRKSPGGISITARFSLLSTLLALSLECGCDFWYFSSHYGP